MPALALLLGLVAPAQAARRFAPAGGDALAQALRDAMPGDTVVAGAGLHHGSFRVGAPIALVGEPGAVLHGGGRGTVLTVAAGGASVSDLEVCAGGRRVLTVDAGVHVVKSGGVVLRRMRVHDVLYGIYAERAPGLRIEDCELSGRVPPLKEDGEGNGVHLWYSDDPVLARNTVECFVDGIYLSFVNRAELRGNRLRDSGRYGLHTMYCQEMDLLENVFTRSVAGCAIMFTNRLQVVRNDFWRNRGPRTYGLLLRDCSAGHFEDNRFVDNTVAIFFDNSNRNRFTGNLIQDNGWGIVMFASCAKNEVAGNAFVHNDYPVALDMRRTDNRFDDGARGNYWSEAAPFDLDGDGVSDAPHGPVNAFSFLSKQYPDLSILAKSPAVAALGVAERVMPALRPSEAVDRYPALRPSRARGTGAPLARDGTGGPARAAAAGFGLLALAGLGGVFAARRAP
jgi:nitrous oxidase accessory protein